MAISESEIDGAFAAPPGAPPEAVDSAAMSAGGLDTVAVLRVEAEDVEEEINRPRVLGLRRSALIETALFFALVIGIGYSVGAGTSYFGVRPHPFWPIVILIAAQYGTNEGLFAAALASLALLLPDIPVQSPDQDLYQYVFALSFQPLMWIVTAVLLGELRNRHRREFETEHRGLRVAERRERLLAEAYRRVNRIKMNLETRVAGQLRTFVTAYQAAKALERQDPGEVLLGVVDVVRSVLSPQQFSLFLLNNNVLEASISDGWSPRDTYSRVFTSDHPIFQEVIGRHRVLCSANPSDEQLLGHQGVLAGPLLSTDTDEVIGMLKIERLPLLDLNVSNVQNFSTLCSWIGTSFAKALGGSSVLSAGALSGSHQMFSYRVLSEQSKLLSALGERFGFDVGMLELQLENVNELEPEVRVTVPGLVSETIKKTLRNTDLGFEYQKADREFVIMLPGTPPEMTQLVADRLLAAMKTALAVPAPRLRMSVRTRTIYQRRASDAAADFKAGPKAGPKAEVETGATDDAKIDTKDDAESGGVKRGRRAADKNG